MTPLVILTAHDCDAVAAHIKEPVWLSTPTPHAKRTVTSGSPVMITGGPRRRRVRFTMTVYSVQGWGRGGWGVPECAAAKQCRDRLLLARCLPPICGLHSSCCSAAKKPVR